MSGSSSIWAVSFCWSVRPVPGFSWWPVMPVMRLSSSRTGMAEWETVLRRPSEVSMSMTSLT